MTAHSNGKGVELVLGLTLFSAHEKLANFQLGKLCVRIQNSRYANILTFEQQAELGTSVTAKEIL